MHSFDSKLTNLAEMCDEASDNTEAADRPVHQAPYRAAEAIIKSIKVVLTMIRIVFKLISTEFGQFRCTLCIVQCSSEHITPETRF